ncbi:MAG: hypothetical protein WCL28_07135 [bacterium]
MRRILIATGFLGLASSSVSVAQPEVHSYTIPRVAATEEQCHQVESWVVEKFARLADARVLTSGCERNPHRTFDLVIEYARSVSANLVTTFDDHAYANALYDTAEVCVANREADMATFKEATGLEPLIAYCIQDRRDHDIDNGWTMRIDGFGKPTLSPQHLSRDFYNNINGDVQSLQEALKSTLESYGAKNVKVKLKASSNHSIVHAMYYASRRLPILQYSEGRFSSLENCERYRGEMAEIYSAAGGQTAIFFCGASSYSSTVYVYSAGVVMQPLATDLTAVKYSTAEACELKREESEASWRDGLEKNVVGSVCAIEDAVTYDNVRMRMFWLE